MTHAILFVLTFLAALLAVGLLSYNGEHQRQVHLKGGRSVTCIEWKQGYAGGISCDWSGRR